MSDHNNEIVVIVAGYKQEMKDFIATNPGLQSRFNTWVEFEDYTEDELYAIFEACATRMTLRPKMLSNLIFLPILRRQKQVAVTSVMLDTSIPILMN